MITIRKLATLRRETRLRKIVAILQEYEMMLHAGRRVDLELLSGLGRLLFEDGELPPGCRERLLPLSTDTDLHQVLRLCNSARHDLLAYLGAEPADWDFVVANTGGLDAAKRVVFPIVIYLDDVRSPFNVGSILRCADAFGVSRVLLSESTPLPSHPRAKRVSMGCWEIVPWEVASHESLAADENLFALETGGTSLDSFAFPPRGTMIVGSEELGVSPELLSLAEKRRGRVSIPLFGVKASLNVAQALSIVLYRWTQSLKGAG